MKNNTDDVPASIWPVIAANSPNLSASNNMPFTESFWQRYKVDFFGKGEELKNVKGYFTTLPVHWTEMEDNLIPYNMRLIANNTSPADDTQQLADNRNGNITEGDWS